MKPKLILFLAITVLASWGEVCPAEETIEHAGARYWIYRLNPKKEKLELFLGEKKGKPNTFPQLEARLNREGRQLKFAINAGIFETSFLPTGLHIANGKQIVDLNLRDFKKTREGEFTPNFYLKPNGVFYLLEDGSAGIVESSRMRTIRLTSKIRIANQSGPLLVNRGKIHPVLTKDSTSKRHRNGIGITPEGMIVFACTALDPEYGLSNLYNFSTLFKQKLNCPDALYLDGDLSYVYIRDQTQPLRESNWFGGIFAVTEKKP